MRRITKAAVAAATFLAASAVGIAVAPVALASPSFTCAGAAIYLNDPVPGSTYVLGRTVAGAITFNLSTDPVTPCGTSTVTNTDAISVNQSGGSYGGLAALVTIQVDLTNGPLAPGVSLESDTPEIETFMSLDYGTRVQIKGSAGNDVFKVGSDGTGFGGDVLVNLNGDTDSDLTASLANSLEVRGEGGSDTLDSTGATLGGAPATSTILVPGPGTNTITGGSGFDTVDFSGYGGTNGVVASMSAATSLTESDTMTGVESLVGTPQHDALTGGAGDDRLEGGGSTQAPDVLDGGGGTDTIAFTEVGSGVTADLSAQTVSANAGAAFMNMEGILGSLYDDVLKGSAGNDYLNGWATAAADSVDSLTGGLGDDFLAQSQGRAVVSFAGAPSAETVVLGGLNENGSATGGDGTDSLYGWLDVVGSNFDDSIQGSDLPESLSGGAGDDIIAPGGAGDVLTGGAGSNTVSLGSTYSTYSRFVYDGTAANAGTVWVNFQSSTFTGFQNAQGGRGQDVVSGLPVGAHDVSLGTAVDTIDYSTMTAPLFIVLDDAANDGTDGLSNIHSDVENIVGGSGNDVFYGSGLGNTFTGGAGNDQLLGRGGNDTLNGGLGDDSLYGQTGDDTLNGDVGNDLLSGGDGGDIIHGGDGNDRLAGGTGDDDVYGDAGTDALNEPEASANGSDYLSGGTGSDTVSYAGRGAAVRVSLNNRPDDGSTEEFDQVLSDVENVTGGSGSDTLVGSSIANVLHGGPGNDILDGGSGADAIFGDTGVDTVSYSTRTVALTIDLDNVADDGAAGEADNIRSDIENVTGGSGADRITGSSAANRIAGGAGNDILTGGTGVDYLDGSTGNDTLYGRDGVKDSLVGGVGTDRANVDAIDVRSGVEALF